MSPPAPLARADLQDSPADPALPADLLAFIEALARADADADYEAALRDRHPQPATHLEGRRHV